MRINSYLSEPITADKKNGYCFFGAQKSAECLLEAGPDDDGLPEEGGHALVHEGVGLDEVQSEVRQRATVVVADPRPRIRHFRTLYGQPIRVYGRLLFERALERIGDVFQRECTNCTSGYAVRRRRKRSVYKLRRYVAVLSLN